MGPRVHIDGSMLEGGGQILRSSTALAAITGTTVSVDAIRAKRTKPGLQAQHLTGLQLVESICGGSLQGGALGSSSIELRPGVPRCARYAADTRTAGSCTLMVQASLPVCLFATGPEEQRGGQDNTPSTSGRPACALQLRGGTDAAMAPPAAYLTDVLVPLLRRLYGDLLGGLEVKTVRRGFYPRGGGEMSVLVPSLPPGTPLPPLNLTERGSITQVTILAFSAGRLPASVAKQIAASAEAAVRRTLARLGPADRRAPVLVEATAEPPERAIGDGCGVLLLAETDTGCRFGATAQGERGVSSQAVGERAAAELAEALTSGSCVDQWMQDQLVIWMALSSGVSRMRCSEPTLHTRTGMMVCEALLPGVKFSLHRPRSPAAGNSAAADNGAAGPTGAAEGASGGLWLIECAGAGWVVGQRAQ